MADYRQEKLVAHGFPIPSSTGDQVFSRPHSCSNPHEVKNAKRPNGRLHFLCSPSRMLPRARFDSVESKLLSGLLAPPPLLNGDPPPPFPSSPRGEAGEG